MRVLNLRIAGSLLFHLAWLASPLMSAQEGVREIDKPGSFNKYLTPSTMDRWTFSGKKGETVTIEVRTHEFDAVVSMIRADGASKETVLETVDEEGSNCRMVFRLPSDGSYKIGVQGFEQKGGGNYSLNMQKCMAKEISLDQPVNGEFDRDGVANFYFSTTQEQYITIDNMGTKFSGAFTLTDSKGGVVNPWGSLYTLEEPDSSKPNEYQLRVRGNRGKPFQFRLKFAERGVLEKDLELNLASQQAAVLDITGIRNTLRILEVRSSHKTDTRLVYAPKRKLNVDSLNQQIELPDLKSLAEFGKGKDKNYVVMLGRDDRYQLQVLATADTKVSLKQFSPQDSLAVGPSSSQTLKLGEFRFYQLQPKSGQTLTLRVISNEFDPMLHLFDQRGDLIEINDDYNYDRNSQLRYTAYLDAPLLVAVSSVGNGGGGKFELSAQADVPNAIASGESKKRSLGETGSDLWLYQAKEAEQVIFYCKCPSLKSLIVMNSRGIEIASQEPGDSEGGIAMLVKFPKAGDYTIQVAGVVGEQYGLQVIPAQ
ncbi:MAG: hypothetical protein U0930_21405 [Pirellulales bacterium]